MIVRSWHGIVPAEKGEAFREHLLKTGVAEVKLIPGNLGADIYNHLQAGWEHFFMVSYWESFEAVKAFAGLDPQIAVCYPEDDRFGLISDPIVLHHEIEKIPVRFPEFEADW